MENNEKEVLFSVSHLKKYFQVGNHATLKAVDDVSFEIYKGETLGMVGESGCGKTTCGRTCIGLYDKTDGQVLYKGTDVHALNGKEQFAFKKQVQMVFQDPLASFDPKMKIVDILTEPLINFGKLKKSEKEAKARELLEMVELPGDFVDRYPHNMSGGQRQRISIARALSLEPEILVCDEATSALDVSVQESVIELLVRLQKEKNISMLFICHDLALIRSFAHQIAVMYLGQIVEKAECKDLFKYPSHPYTQALLSAVPIPSIDYHVDRIVLEGDVPSPINPSPGCRFAGRCRFCKEKCRHETPELKDIGNGHMVACHFVGEF